LDVKIGNLFLLYACRAKASMEEHVQGWKEQLNGPCVHA
jgi:hypothetical protein